MEGSKCLLKVPADFSALRERCERCWNSVSWCFLGAGPTLTAGRPARGIFACTWDSISKANSGIEVAVLHDAVLQLQALPHCMLGYKILLLAVYKLATLRLAPLLLWLLQSPFISFSSFITIPFAPLGSQGKGTATSSEQPFSVLPHSLTSCSRHTQRSSPWCSLWAECYVTPLPCFCLLIQFQNCWLLWEVNHRVNTGASWKKHSRQCGTL